MSEPTINTNGWIENKKLVYDRLERMSETLNKIDDKVDDITIEIAKLKIKSGVWGLMGGAIVSIPTLLYLIVRMVQ